VVAACAVVAVAAAVRLSRFNAVQEARIGAELAERRKAAALTARSARQVAQDAAPGAIEHHCHGPSIHIHGGDGQQAAARLIRQALTPEPPGGNPR
jgi:hypothetical protein